MQNGHLGVTPIFRDTHIYVSTPPRVKSVSTFFFMPVVLALSCMLCAECRVFEGAPVCGGCRAIARIIALLRSGHLQGQQRRVVEVLRGAAGELSDLAEACNPKGRESASHLGKEETQGLTSGPTLPAKEAEKAGDDSLYSEEDSEEEEKETDTPVVEKVKEEKTEDATRESPVREAVASAPDTGPRPEGDRSQDKQEQRKQEGRAQIDDRRETGKNAPGSNKQARREERRTRKGEASERDQAFLTSHLELYPAPKASTCRDRRPVAHEGSSREEVVAPDGRGSRRPLTPERRPEAEADREDDVDSEGRRPIPRRPAKRSRSRERGTKGAKKRQRAREFTRKKIEERRNLKWQRGWRQKPNQRRKPTPGRRG